MLLDPGVDPERLDADDLFLLVGHGAGHVHHVHDAGDAVGLGDFLPAAVLLVGADRDDDRIDGVVSPRGDLPFHGPLEGALEMAQRFGPGLADAGVLVLGGDDVLLALRLDARQGEFFAEDVGQFFEREIDLENVAAGLIAGAAFAFVLRVRSAVGPDRRRLARRRRSPFGRSGTAAARSTAAGC